MAPRKTTTAKSIPPAPPKAAAPKPTPQPDAQSEPAPTAPAATAPDAERDAPAPAKAAPSAVSETRTSVDGLVWTDEVNPRGRVVTVSKGAGPTTTHEEVLLAGATDAQAEAAKQRLYKRFLAN